MTPKREQTLRQSIQMDPKRHRFHNKAALILTVVSFGLLMTLSFLFSSPVYRQQRLLDEDNEDDFSQFSCRYIFEKVPDSGYAQCRFAKTCNGGEGIWSSWVFCRYNTMSVRTLFLILSPFIALWMTILFRLLGSTAEDYFSPSLEMFSVKLGLPPRFAGVSLLALGNGAADVSATMSAISGDEENGYKLSLGALSGAAMLVGGVVSGLVIITAGGVPCRGALVRDVMALLITVVIVWTNLASGSIGPGAYSLFLSLYGFFVFTVLVADVYHRAIVMPRLRQAVADGDTPEDPTFSSEQQTSAISRFITSISNYDNISGFGPWAQRTNTSDQPIVDEHTAALSIDQPAPENDAVSVIEQNTPVNLLGRHGVLRGDGRALSAIPGSDPNDSVGAYTLVDEQIDQFCSTGGPGADISASNWSGAWYDGSNELRTHMNKVWEDIASNGDLSQAEKFILICELPFTIGRQITVPIPCDGYYCRALIALSMIVSPFWFAYYIYVGHDVNMFASNAIVYFFSFWLLGVFVGACILRYAPGGEGRMSMAVATPIALYGFLMAATWIDYVADHLVDVLNFCGIVLRIPGSIMGLTILAWGNSMADLSANITMARKGLANMAMTACFAGPVFNILIGLGLGFSSLAAQTGNSSTTVSVGAPVMTGFIFIILNCIAILVTGIFLGKGRIESYYGYIAVGLYTVYVIASISLQFSKYGESD